MNKFVLLSLLAAIFLSACQNNSAPTQIPIRTVAEFEHALEIAGVQVQPTSQLAPELPEAESRTWQVRDELIYVYTFPDQGARERGVKTIIDAKPFLTQPGQELKIWERQSFLIVYSGTDGGTVLLISGLLGDAATQLSVGPDEPYPPAVSAAQRVLAEELGISPALVRVTDYESMIWPDSCLGIQEEDETCAEVETNGWRIYLSAQDESYTLHSDATGQVIRRPDY